MASAVQVVSTCLIDIGKLYQPHQPHPGIGCTDHTAPPAVFSPGTYPLPSPIERGHPQAPVHCSTDTPVDPFSPCFAARVAGSDWSVQHLNQARIQRQRHPWTGLDWIGLDLIAPQQPNRAESLSPSPNFSHPRLRETAKPFLNLHYMPHHCSTTSIATGGALSADRLCSLC